MPPGAGSSPRAGWHGEGHALSGGGAPDTLNGVVRALLAFLLAVVFVVLVPLGDLGAWAQRELVGTDSFARLGEQVLDQGAVRDALADRIVGDIEASVPALIGNDTTLRSVVAHELGLPQVKPAFDELLASTHDQLRQGQDPLQLDLAPVLPVLREQLPASLAARLPSQVSLAPVTVLRRSDAPAVWEGVQLVQDSALALPIAAMVALAFAIAAAHRRGLLCIVLGVVTAGVGVGLVALVKPGRSLLEHQTGTPSDRAAFLAGYNVVTQSFVRQTVGVVIAGALLVVVGGVLAWRAGRNVRPLSWA